MPKPIRRARRRLIVAGACWGLALTGWSVLAAPAASGEPEQGASAPLWPFEVVADYPHDRRAYTQGLVFADGVLYESTGLYGRSQLRRVDPQTGRVRHAVRLAREQFGEGLAKVGERFLQLTWREGQCLVYRGKEFSPFGRFDYPGEGWGLAYDGRDLFMSDGTAVITVRDPDDFGVRRRIRVRDGARSVTGLNELEVIDGRIFANVYPSPRIAIIDPRTGVVIGWLDLSVLATRERRRAGVVNGIAYDPESARVLVTGKLWSRLYALRVDAPDEPNLHASGRQ